MIVSVDCDSLPGLQKPLFPGLCCWRWRGLKKLQCLSFIHFHQFYFCISILSTQSYLYHSSWLAWESPGHSSYTRLFKHTSSPSNKTMRNAEKTSEMVTMAEVCVCVPMRTAKDFFLCTVVHIIKRISIILSRSLF